jgi:hypothetical protein
VFYNGYINGIACADLYHIFNIQGSNCAMQSKIFGVKQQPINQTQ